MSNAVSYIIIQSDDWGFCAWSPDQSAFETARQLDDGKVGQDYWGSTLESPHDLHQLFEVLAEFEGGDGFPAKIQANYILANADFGRIAAAGYKKWYGIELPDVPPRWRRGDIVEAAKKGIEAGVWQAEHHGYAHIDLRVLLRLLRAGDNKVMKLFQSECLPLNCPEVFPEYASGVDEEHLLRGIELFRELFGYAPRSTCPPNYVVSNDLASALSTTSISILQGANRFHFASRLVRQIARLSPSTARSLALRGNKCQLLDRSTDFEPRGQPERATEDPHWRMTFRDIERALQSTGIAIVSTHRLNFVHHDRAWVEAGLRQLRQLLHAVKQRFPEAVYVSDWEYVQIQRWGVSASPRGAKIAVRNFTGGERLVTLDPATGELLGVADPSGSDYRPPGKGVMITVPAGSTIINVKQLEQRSPT
jgi:hypothetical protein